MHAEHFLDAEALEHTVAQHRLGAGAALLRRLENHHRGAGKVAGVGEVLGGAEQHGGVAVMAAGVHLARHGGLVGEIGRFLDRQRVHVGAQPHHLAAGFAATDDADHAGPPDAGHDLVAAEALELVGDRRRGAVHVVLEFRMGMDVPPPGRDLGMQVGDAVDDGHGEVLARGVASGGAQCSKWRPGRQRPAAGRSARFTLAAPDAERAEGW